MITFISTLTKNFKVSVINFSAPFLAQFFSAALQSVLPYIDIVICNEAEAEAWANATGLPNPTDLKAVAKAIAILPKNNSARPRLAVITHGAESTIVVSSDAPDAAKEYGVTKLSDDQIVDTNGAGDAFAGGFLGAYVLGKSVDDSVEAGHKLASLSIQEVCSFRSSSSLRLLTVLRWARNTSGPKSAFSRLTFFDLRCIYFQQ